jgi:DNA-binding XRE family transcriptional regulator
MPHELTKVAPNIYQKSNGGFEVRAVQNGRRIFRTFRPGTPREHVDRYVQKVKDGRRRQFPNKLRVERPTRVAPNIYRWRSGRWYVRVYQNGTTIEESFPSETPQPDVERFVQKVKDERRLQRVTQNSQRSLSWVAPHMFRRRSGRWLAQVQQNGRQVKKGFPRETPQADVERWVQDTKDQGQRRPAKKIRQLTKVAPNIFRARSGRLLARVNRNGQRLLKLFPPKTRRGEVERFVRKVKEGRRLRRANENRRLTRIAPNIFQTPSGRWRAIVRQNGQLIVQGFPRETPQADVERFVQNVIAGRRSKRGLAEGLAGKATSTKRETPLSQWRKKLGLKLADLAALGGVQLAAACAHCNGRRLPSLTVRGNYAKGLSDLSDQTITIDDLFPRALDDRLIATG